MRDRWYGGWIRFRLIVLACYVIAAVVVVHPLAAPDVLLALSFLVVVPPLYSVLTTLFARREWARVEQGSRPQGDGILRLLPGSPLRDTGLRHVEVRTDDGRLNTTGRALRLTDRGLIVLPARWDALSHAALRGLVLHEAAHLVRHDPDRQRWLACLGFAGVIGLGAAGRPTAVWASAAVGVVVVGVALSWWAEWSADGFVRRRDPAAAAAFAAYLDGTTRTPWQSARGRLTHPPDAWRVRNLRRPPG